MPNGSLGIKIEDVQSEGLARWLVMRLSRGAGNYKAESLLFGFLDRYR